MSEKKEWWEVENEPQVVDESAIISHSDSFESIPSKRRSQRELGKWIFWIFLLLWAIPYDSIF
jgi:hypothetical protein